MNTEERRAMANRIKDRRKEMQYTQEQIAELLGISASSYRRIENIFQNPALDTLIKISRCLNVSLDYLVFGSVERKPSDVYDADVLNALLQYVDRGQLLHASEFLARVAKITPNE